MRPTAFIWLLVVASSCSAPARPAVVPPAPAPAPIEPPATAPVFPPLESIPHGQVRPWPRPAVAIRLPVAAAPAAPAPPDDRPARALLDADIRTALRRTTRTSPIETQLDLARLYQRRAAVAEPADAPAFEARARALLRAVVTSPAYRNQPGYDAALMQYATLIVDTDPARARTLVAELIKTFPTSPQVADAYLLLAEYSFAQGDLANAERFYRKVIALGMESTHDFATYKLAWTSWNLGKETAALELLTRVIGTTSTSDANRRLRAQALKDLARFYAHIGAAARAAGFFAGIDRGHEVAHLDRLADAYEDLGKYVESTVVYLDLVARAPTDPRVCVWWQGAARSAEAVGDVEAQLAHSRSLIETAACSGDPAVRDTVGRLARRLHREASATAEPAALARVARLYRAYLANVPDAVDADLVRFYVARLSWDAALAERDPTRASAAWAHLASECAQSTQGELEPEDRALAAACTIAAVSNAVAVADAFEARTPELVHALRASLEAVAARAPARLEELRGRLAR